MKKILIIICITLASNFLRAQNTAPPEPPTSSDQQNPSQKKYWIEFQNGRFKSDYNFVQDGSERLVLETKLYDTGHGGPPPSIILINNGTNLSFDNNQHILSSGRYVYVQPSVAEVVAGDMMVMSVTYLPMLDTALMPGVDITFSVILLYNQDNGDAFFNETIPGASNDSRLMSIRCNNGETIETGLTSDLVSAGGVNSNAVSGYKYYILLKGISPGSYERNVFISMMPSKDLTESDSTSIRVLLYKKTSFNSNETTLLRDSYQLNGLQVALAHDPNYLKVSPACISSKKRGGHTINYKLHFQNTGEGAADTVVVSLKLPLGMDLDNFNNNNISKAVYGGMDFKRDLDLISIDKAQNKIIFKFNPYKRRTTGMIFLVGTNDCINPFADKRTMGDIEFTITSTDRADSVLNASASIEFHSKAHTDRIIATGDARLRNRYESAVETNTATVRIRECCDCPNPCINCGPGCYKIAGLCWWWWVIIFAVLTVIYILLRKREKAKKYTA